MLFLDWQWQTEVSTPVYFPYSTKFVICKDGHLHIPKPKLEIPENKSLHSGRDTCDIGYANEGKVHSKRMKWTDKSLQLQIVDDRMQKKTMTIWTYPLGTSS